MNYAINLSDNILFIRLEGDLIEEFRGHKLIGEVNEHIEQGVLLAAIDLSKVRFINSSGIGLLVSLLTKFRNRGGELILINPSDQTKKLLIATKLYAIFSVADDDAFATQLLKESAV